MACIFLYLSPRLVSFFSKRFKFYFKILFQFILFILCLKPWLKFEYLNQFSKVQDLKSDMTMPTTPTSTPTTSTTATPIHVFDGPITCSRAKKLQQEVHALLCEIHFTINESYILPKSCTLLMLRFT
jgi:hypothetical protein